jgi:NADH-quinone oxidoreductase subunit B
VVVAGRVSVKMMPVLQRVYMQMAEPKWVISMGACASTGGEFDTYAVVQGIDQYIPVDVYVPGCPPRPEQLMEAVMTIQQLVDKDGMPARGQARKPVTVQADPTHIHPPQPQPVPLTYSSQIIRPS